MRRRSPEMPAPADRGQVGPAAHAERGTLTATVWSAELAS